MPPARRRSCRDSPIPFAQTTVDRAQGTGKKYELSDGEDTDLILRVSQTGRKVWVVHLPEGRRLVIGPAAAFTLKGARDTALAYIRHNGPPPKPEPESDPHEPAGPLTLGHFLKRAYVPDFEERHPDPGKHLHNLKAFADLEGLPVDEITPLTLDEWLKKRLRAVKKSTARRNLAALKAALAWGHRKTLVSADTLRGYRSDRLKGYDTKRLRFLDADEEKRLRLAVRKFSAHFQALVLSASNTGMRKSELYALTWDAVDLARKQSTVRAETSKSGRSRVIPMSAELVRILSGQPGGCSNSLQANWSLQSGAQTHLRCARIHDSW